MITAVILAYYMTEPSSDWCREESNESHCESAECNDTMILYESLTHTIRIFS